MTSILASFPSYTHFVQTSNLHNEPEQIEAFTKALCEHPEGNNGLISEWIARVSQTGNQTLIEKVSSVVAKVPFKKPHAPH